MILKIDLRTVNFRRSLVIDDKIIIPDGYCIINAEVPVVIERIGNEDKSIILVIDDDKIRVKEGDRECTLKKGDKIYIGSVKVEVLEKLHS